MPDKPPLLSICMIVRDEAERIAACLARHKDLADEIVVVDTGSTDDTASIASRCGAAVSSFEWRDDFAAARNFSLTAASGTWLLILDPDEWIEPGDFGRLRRLCDETVPSVAFSMTTRNYSNDSSLIDWIADHDPPAPARDYFGYYPSNKVRLFPSRRDIEFEGEIHEIVETALVRLSIPMRFLDVAVHHLHERPDSPERSAARRERYLRLSRKKSERLPNDPKALHEHGMIAFECEQFAEAADILRRAAALAPDSEDIAVLSAAAGIRLGDFQGVKKRLESRRKRFARSPRLHAILGEAYQGLGDLARAEKSYVHALQIKPDYHHVLILLGNLLMATERETDALAYLERAIRLDPLNEIAFTNAGMILAALGQYGQASQYLRMATRIDPGVWIPHFYLGQIAQAQGRFDEAREDFCEALKIDPENPRVKEALDALG
ncbi:tetratricopeptide repeat protein [Candidatus Sumerlaeota bacterium]|nr:tetratricopeptide repeat protein [Candidatus Sumerlaeota bacterium]